jgi:hypothetical protein
MYTLWVVSCCVWGVIVFMAQWRDGFIVHLREWVWNIGGMMTDTRKGSARREANLCATCVTAGTTTTATGLNLGLRSEKPASNH